MKPLDVYDRQHGGQVVGQVYVDDDLFEQIDQCTWSGTPEGYARRQLPNGGGDQYMHYFVWEHHKGIDSVPDEMYLDHKDQNKKNNQFENLQVVSDRVKNANAPMHSDNIAGFKGVSARPNGRFEACVGRDYKIKYAGRYATATEAAYAVNLAYKILHPEIELVQNEGVEMALTEQQRASIEANVQRLLRPDREPGKP